MLKKLYNLKKKYNIMDSTIYKLFMWVVFYIIIWPILSSIFSFLGIDGTAVNIWLTYITLIIFILAIMPFNIENINDTNSPSTT